MSSKKYTPTAERMQILRQAWRYDIFSDSVVWREQPRERFKTERAWKKWNEKKAGRPVFPDQAPKKPSKPIESSRILLAWVMAKMVAVCFAASSVIIWVALSLPFAKEQEPDGFALGLVMIGAIGLWMEWVAITHDRHSFDDRAGNIGIVSLLLAFGMALAINPIQLIL
jgi:hypothetical protein